MGFWDEPTTILDPSTGLPLMGRQFVTPARIKRVSALSRTVIGNLTFNGVNYEEITLAVGGSYGLGDSVRLTSGGGKPGRMPIQPFDDTTANRPTNVSDGTMFFDITLGIPIFAKSTSSTKWINAAGAEV